MSQLQEKQFSDDSFKTVSASTNEIVVHIADCKGCVQSQFKKFIEMYNSSGNERLKFQSLLASIEGHEEHDCELLGSFALVDKLGFLFLHSGDNSSVDTTEADTLESLKSAARDMLAKIPKDSTLHSFPFSLSNIGGPSWGEILLVFQEVLKDTPDVKWLFWNDSKANEGPQLCLEDNLLLLRGNSDEAKLESTKKSISSGDAIFAEIDSVDDLFVEGGPETAVNKPKTVNGSLHNSSWVPTVLKNVRDSVLITKVRSSTEKKAPVKESAGLDAIEESPRASKVQFTIFKDYGRKKSQGKGSASTFASNVRSTFSSSNIKRLWGKLVPARRGQTSRTVD